MNRCIAIGMAIESEERAFKIHLNRFYFTIKYVNIYPFQLTFNWVHYLTNDKYWSMLSFCRFFHFWIFAPVGERNCECLFDKKSAKPIIWRNLFAQSSSFKRHLIRMFHYITESLSKQFYVLYFVTVQWIFRSRIRMNQVKIPIKYAIIK